MAGFSDKDLQMASYIAYLNFSPADVAAHPDWSIRDHITNGGTGINEELKQDIIMRGGEDLYNALKEPGSNYGDWKIVDINNQNVKDGFCGCVIETSPNEAIVGFRGSEDFTKLDNFVNDWIKADTGLLNSVRTEQQKSAEAYMQAIEKKFGDKYDNYSVTGHSLGGNLAEHATVTASDDMAAKIDRTVSFDGPGFSDEYLKAHKGQIEKNAHLIDHYQHSLVGSFLTPLPGTNYRHIDADGKVGYFWKHDLKNIYFDEYGNVKTGTQDAMAVGAEMLSKLTDLITNKPGIYGVFQMLPYLLPVIGIGIGAMALDDSFLNKIEEWADQYAEKMREVRENTIKAEFKINSDAVISAGTSIENVAVRLAEIMDEVESVKNEISIFLKLGSFYTISYKLRKSAENLEKLSQRSTKMGQTAERCAETYVQYEQNVLANAQA